MKLLIDNMNVTTGWSASVVVPVPVIYGLNQHKGFIAGLNLNSVIFKFPDGGLNGYVTKTFSVNVSDYTELVLHIWSRNKKSEVFKEVADYYYKITLAAGVSYYIETKNQLNPVVLDISALTTITELTITSLHNDEDYLIVSEVMVVKDEFPYDIFVAIQDQLELDIDSTIIDGILIGTTTTRTGEKDLTVSSYIGFLDRYSVIKIKDITNSEVHQVQEFSNGLCLLGTLFDGKEVLHNYSAANVYLQIPVSFGNYEKEIMLPSISIWGLSPEFVLRGSKLEQIYDSWLIGTGISSRQEGQILKFNVVIDCEARETELVALCSAIVRKFIGREELWLNNRKMTIKFEGTPSVVEPTEGYDIVPKIQYECSLELKEELWQRTSLPLVTTTNIQVEPV